MHYTIKQESRTQTAYKLTPFANDLKLFDRNKGGTDDITCFIDLNPLVPVEILGTEWTKWNEPDIIKFKSASGGVYIVQDEKLLADICRFMDLNGFKGRLPCLHIQGKDEWECFLQPEEIQILEYLWAYHFNYDIYSCDGTLIREANNEEIKFDFRDEYL